MITPSPTMGIRLGKQAIFHLSGGTHCVNRQAGFVVFATNGIGVHLMRNILLGLTAFSATYVAAAVPAAAAPLPNGYQTFNFAGVCSDCIGTGLAELTLQNYTVGSQINVSNFVSFHYDGTNLLPAFTISSGELPYLYGSMSGPFPTTENFTVASNSKVFSTSSGGFWCVGPSCLADYGYSHTWAQAIAIGSAVPEPATWALMILGMGAVGYAMRRRQKVTTRISYVA